MPDTFLNYLLNERRRLDRERTQASARGASAGDISRLDQLRRIVDDQLTRWSHDLTTDRLAA